MKYCPRRPKWGPTKGCPSLPIVGPLRMSQLVARKIARPSRIPVTRPWTFAFRCSSRVKTMSSSLLSGSDMFYDPLKILEQFPQHVEFGTAMNGCRIEKQGGIPEKCENPATNKARDETVEQSHKDSLG